MLRTNLSTRPFYNERAVHWVLALALVAILALTAFNVTRVLALSQQQSALATAAERDEAQAAALRSEASSLRAGIDQKALEHVVKAAEEANDIIDQRTFSWTELLNHIERTLPNGVMLTSVSPHVDKGRVDVSLVVLGRSVETVDDFIEKMEATRAFSEMSPMTERVTETGLFEVTITGEYHPGMPLAAEKSDKSDTSNKGDKADTSGKSDEGEPAEGEGAKDAPATTGKPGASTPGKPTVTPPPASKQPAPRSAAPPAGPPVKRGLSS